MYLLFFFSHEWLLFLLGYFLPTGAEVKGNKFNPGVSKSHPLQPEKP